MARALFQHSAALRADGTPYAAATFKFELLTPLASRAGEGVLRRPVWRVATDLEGKFPTGLAIETPESGAWLWRMRWPDGQVADAYIEQGDGSGIEIDDWITLAGQAGSEAGTPQGQFLLRLYEAVAEADDHALLETVEGDVALTNAPRGWLMQRTSIPAGETVTIPVGHQMMIYGALGVDGVLVASGELVIL